MTPEFLTEIAGLVDWLAERPVREIKVKDKDTTLFLKFRAPDTTGQTGETATAEVRASGTGFFHHRHPDTNAEMFCIEAGAFLFPVSTGDATPTPVAGDGTRVEFGTSLLKVAPAPSEKATLT
ncbi:hypothetical protein [Celeribacter sp.]|uniref:hypothetical protein n=1 Tax=Celeribacter sp. TaxID=1890673 RepID=UPI003A94719E